MLEVIERPDVLDCAERVRAEYKAFPGLSLTKPQMRRLWDMDAGACDTLIEVLLLTRVLRRTADGSYVAYDSAY